MSKKPFEDAALLCKPSFNHTTDSEAGVKAYMANCKRQREEAKVISTAHQKALDEAAQQAKKERLANAEAAKAKRALMMRKTYGQSVKDVVP